jgi:hypothetical protein
LYDKMWLYSGLLVLVLALMGFGIWFVLNPGDKVDIPECEPLVLMDINNPEKETLSQLSIYEDGTVIFIEDSNVEMPISQGDEFTRTWRTGEIDSGDIEYFFSYLESIDFDEIETTFTSPDAFEESITEGTPENRRGLHIVPGGPIDYIRISVDNGQIENTVEAIGYIVSGSEPYSELPYPVNFIHAELAEIIENNTKEVLMEELTK